MLFTEIKTTFSPVNGDRDSASSDFFLRHFHNVEGDRRLLLMVLLFTCWRANTDALEMSKKKQATLTQQHTFAVDTVAAASSDGDRESWIGRSSEDDAGRLRR